MKMATHQGRRRFLAALSAAGAAGFAGLGRELLAAEPPPETTRIRLNKPVSICLAPMYVAEELLRAEGFREVHYVGDPRSGGGMAAAKAMGGGEVDFGMSFAGPLVMALDTGIPVVLLGGVHVGCFELFCSERVRTLADLKGRAVAASAFQSTSHIFLASIATSVGLDPERDINWVFRPGEEAKQQLAAGKIDAYIAFPPDPQELRAKRIGKVLLNSAVDRPWSQYFCCLIAANREFVRRHPVATRRATRALLKASDICATDPEGAATTYLKQGYGFNPDFVRQAIRELPYKRWREYNPEETVRFYALRLREAGMVKGAPQKLIAQGTDWRFLNELKKELKT